MVDAPEGSPGRRFAPRRPLGRTGFVASVLGIGDVADRDVPFDECVSLVRRALDAGLNVIDTAPGYEDGYSEEIVGAAVRDRRGEVFVIDKIDYLDRPVGPQLEASRVRLGLETIDLVVFHSVTDIEQWEMLAAKGGGMDQLAECVEAGMARWRGISAHHPDVLRAAIVDGRADVLLFAVGPCCHPAYIEEILPLARARGVGTIGFKTFGAGKLLGDTEGYGQPLRPASPSHSHVAERAAPHLALVPVEGEAARRPKLPHLEVEECIRYTMTCDPDVALLGLSAVEEQDAAFAAAEAFEPLTPGEMEWIRRRAAAAVEGKGPCWWDPQPRVA